MKKRMVFALLARQQVFRPGILTLAPCSRSQPPVSESAKSEIETAFEAKKGTRRPHEARIAAGGKQKLIPWL
jgi:hypothetical protein